MEILFILCTYQCYYLALNHTICPFPTPHKVRVYTLEYLRPTTAVPDLVSQFY